jgi:hypothetical protein
MTPRILALYAGMALATGCGPIIATSNIVQADAALEEAKMLNAQRYAPYWFHSANIYLKKARDLDGHSEYQYASEYAGIALVRANKSLEISRRRMRARPGTAAPAGGGGYSW